MYEIILSPDLICVHTSYIKPTNDYILNAGTYIHQKRTLIFFTNNFFLFEQSKNVNKESDIQVIILGITEKGKSLWKKKTLGRLLCGEPTLCHSAVNGRT